MREAYLVNNSQSVVSIPLYEKVQIEFRGRTVQKVQFKKLVPGEEFKLGFDISVAKKKYYSQFKSILVDLKFRDVEGKVENNDASQTSVETEVSEEAFDEAALMKKRQAELLQIAADLGIEATAQNSKAEIAKMILEKKSIG